MASSVTREIVIGAPPERVFDVIADYHRYPEFVPAVKSCRPRREDDGPGEGGGGGSVVIIDYTG